MPWRLELILFLIPSINSLSAVVAHPPAGSTFSSVTFTEPGGILLDPAVALFCTSATNGPSVTSLALVFLLIWHLLILSEKAPIPVPGPQARSARIPPERKTALEGGCINSDDDLSPSRLTEIL